MLIHPDSARFNPRRDFDASGNVACPNDAAQSIIRAVRLLNRVLDGIVGEDRKNRSELFFADQPSIVRQSLYDCRPDEVAAAFNCSPPGYDRAIFFPCAVDEAEHFLVLSPVLYWSDRRSG